MSQRQPIIVDGIEQRDAPMILSSTQTDGVRFFAAEARGPGDVSTRTVQVRLTRAEVGALLMGLPADSFTPETYAAVVKVYRHLQDTTNSGEPTYVELDDVAPEDLQVGDVTLWKADRSPFGTVTITRECPEHEGCQLVGYRRLPSTEDWVEHEAGKSSVRRYGKG